MSHVPDPRIDFLAAIEWIIEQTARNAEDLKTLKDAIGVKTVYGIPDLARRWGLSTSALYADPVKLPNFGRADVGTGRKLWRRETVEAWESLSEEEHRDVWERLSGAEKEKYTGPVQRAAS